MIGPARAVGPTAQAPQDARGRALDRSRTRLLIVLKLVAGAVTGSIAIITEAIHSAIDLVASIVAYFSVRKADEPADEDHPYGHEKVENLAAAIEGMLILVGAGIIIYESVRRLVDGAEVETLGFGIAVIGFSVVANLVVSAYLYRQARAHRLARARGRRRAPAHRRDDLGRRAGRAGAGRDHRRRVARPDPALVVAVGDRRRRRADPAAARRACSSTRRCPRTSWTRSRQAIEEPRRAAR